MVSRPAPQHRSSEGSSPGRQTLDAVLFDFDGTVPETESVLQATWTDEYALAGHCLAPEDWASQTGRRHVDHYEILATLVGPSFDAEACRTRRRSSQDELLRDLGPRPGIVEALSFCRERGIRTAVVSSSPRDWVVVQLGRCGLRHHFDALICREDVHATKPDPAPYLVALDRLSVRPMSAVAVEDAPSGVVSALAAGIPCIAVPNDVTRHLAFPETARVLSDSADLPTALSKYAGAHAEQLRFSKQP